MSSNQANIEIILISDDEDAVGPAQPVIPSRARGQKRRASSDAPGAPGETGEASAAGAAKAAKAVKEPLILSEEFLIPHRVFPLRFSHFTKDGPETILERLPLKDLYIRSIDDENSYYEAYCTFTRPVPRSVVIEWLESSTKKQSFWGWSTQLTTNDILPKRSNGNVPSRLFLEMQPPSFKSPWNLVENGAPRNDFSLQSQLYKLVYHQTIKMDTMISEEPSNEGWVFLLKHESYKEIFVGTLQRRMRANGYEGLSTMIKRLNKMFFAMTDDTTMYQMQKVDKQGIPQFVLVSSVYSTKRRELVSQMVRKFGSDSYHWLQNGNEQEVTMQLHKESVDQHPVTYIFGFFYKVHNGTWRENRIRSIQELGVIGEWSKKDRAEVNHVGVIQTKTAFTPSQIEMIFEKHARENEGGPHFELVDLDVGDNVVTAYESDTIARLGKFFHAILYRSFSDMVYEFRQREYQSVIRLTNQLAYSPGEITMRDMLVFLETENDRLKMELEQLKRRIDRR
jgi:hypothetical protein